MPRWSIIDANLRSARGVSASPRLPVDAQDGSSAQNQAPSPQTANSQHDFPRDPNLAQATEIAHPDQVWVSDITYIRLREEFVYSAVIMDVFTHSIRGWHLGRSLDHTLTLTAQDRALAGHAPEMHHSDQGIPYAAATYIGMLRAASGGASVAEIGEAWQNGYAERLIRTIKEEEVDRSDYECYTDAVSQLGRFLNDVYVHKRIDSSLGYLTPVEFEEQWRRGRDQPLLTRSGSQSVQFHGVTAVFGYLLNHSG